MNRSRTFIVVLCGFAILSLAACGGGIFNGEKEAPNPTATVVKEISAVVARPSSTIPFADEVQALGRSLLTPTAVGYVWGNPPRQFQRTVTLSLVCGDEVAILNPDMFFDVSLLEASVKSFMEENGLEKFPEGDPNISSVVFIGEDFMPLDVKNSVRVLREHGYIIVKAPEGFTSTHAQRGCNFPRGDYRNFNMFDMVYLSGGADLPSNEGNVGFISNAPKDGRVISQGVFTVIPVSPEVLPGSMVFGKTEDGSPVVLGVAINYEPQQGFVPVVAIGTLFPSPKQ